MHQTVQIVQIFMDAVKILGGFIQIGRKASDVFLFLVCKIFNRFGSSELGQTDFNSTRLNQFVVVTADFVQPMPVFRGGFIFRRPSRSR